MSRPIAKTAVTLPPVPYSAWEDIDLAKAQDYLKHNRTPQKGVVGTNRNSSLVTVRGYADAMLRDEWGVTHQGIAFSVSGDLIDGQERLQAIVLAAQVRPDIVIRMLVTRHLPDEAIMYMDLGRRRTAAHFLSMSGEVNVNVLSAVTRLVYCYLFIPLPEIGSVAAWHRKSSITPQMIQKTINEHPGLRDAVATGSSVGKRINRIALSAGIYLAGIERPDADMDFFVEKLKVPSDLAADHPVMVFREHILSQTEYKRLDTDYVLAVLIKSINAFADGRTIGQLRWSLKTERFPRFTKPPKQ